jgi:hypothetical protein
VAAADALMNGGEFGRAYMRECMEMGVGEAPPIA